MELVGELITGLILETCTLVFLVGEAIVADPFMIGESLLGEEPVGESLVGEPPICERRVGDLGMWPLGGDFEIRSLVGGLDMLGEPGPSLVIG